VWKYLIDKLLSKETVQILVAAIISLALGLQGCWTHQVQTQVNSNSARLDRHKEEINAHTSELAATKEKVSDIKASMAPPEAPAPKPEKP
jgi:outer membrane murein-binding lipoprotein Lpp